MNHNFFGALATNTVNSIVRSLIYVLAVADAHDQDEKAIIMNFEDHPIRADADAPCGTAGKLLATCGARLVCESTYSLDDTRLLRMIDLGKLLLSNSQNFDRVTHALESCWISRTACSKGSFSAEPSFAIS